MHKYSVFLYNGLIEPFLPIKLDTTKKEKTMNKISSFYYFYTIFLLSLVDLYKFYNNNNR